MALLDIGVGHVSDATLDLWSLEGILSPGNAPPAEARPSAGDLGGKEKLRLWTSAEGRFTVEAELAADSGDKITLKKKSGAKVEISVAKLSREDRAYVEGLRAAPDK